MDRFPMTPNGHRTLQEELARRKVERPIISKEIEVAREHGDLKENAEYHAAKEKQGLNEAHIKDIESKIALADIIDPTKLSGDTVKFGATVVLENADTGDEVTYQIVGGDEADLAHGKISVTSPVAKALIGRAAGDDVSVRAPKGIIEYEIIEVRWV